MAGRFGRSIQLFSASWGVLREDKSLVVFPIVSGIASLVVVAMFATPVLTLFVHSSTAYDAFGNPQTHVSIHPIGWAVIAVGYVVTMYVGTFMNAALIIAANERLTGTGPGTVGSGFRGAWAKAGAIAGWVLVAATVGYLLRMLEQRLGLIGRIVIAIVGIAWSLLTFLVVPVLVLEENTTGQAISRSSKLFKTTWGENVIGNAGFGLFGFVVALIAFAIFMVGAMTGTVAGMILMGAIALLWLIVAAQILAAMSGIYRVALYRYAVDGRPPQAYTAFDFNSAFRPKKTAGMFTSTRSQTVYRSDPYGSQQPARDPWREWQPPAEEPIQGEFGVEIPGSETLPGHVPPPPRAPQPPPMRPPTGPEGDSGRGWPGASNWPS